MPACEGITESEEMVMQTTKSMLAGSTGAADAPSKRQETHSTPSTPCKPKAAAAAVTAKSVEDSSTAMRRS